MHKINYIITIGGGGTRMKYLSPKDKHMLYYGNKRIIEHLLERFPKAKVIGERKTNSRKETLKEIENEIDCLIIDCDVIPLLDQKIDFQEDTIFIFESEKNKYGSLNLIENRVIGVSEKENISNVKCSGVYFVKSVSALLKNMTDDNSIASGMIGAKTIKESTFIRLGDVEDYFEAL
jgi:dTDP-glucose pyrophosphorylase